MKKISSKLYSYGNYTKDKVSSKYKNNKLYQLKKSGFLILKNIFNSRDCDVAKSKIDIIYKKQIKEFGGEKNLKIIDDNNVVRALFCYDDYFKKFLFNSKIKSMLKECFEGRYIINLQNAPINRAYSAHFGSAWHRDLPFQTFVSSKPIAMNVLVCLDDFTKQNGATFVVPKSHKVEHLPNKVNLKNTKQLIAKKGDVIFLDAMLYHRAGENLTSKDRNLIVNMFTLPFVKPQLNYSKMLKKKSYKNKKLFELIGSDLNIEESVYNWRMRRKKRYINNPNYFNKKSG